MIALYAHRLGRAYGPDNSRTALAGALAADADGLECDVCLTADDELVLLHDPWLAFGTDLKGWAHERTAAELRRARRSGGEAPLFLDELLAVVPRDLVLQVEVKAHADPELATRTVEALAVVLARGGRAPRRGPLVRLGRLRARRLSGAARAGRHLGRLRAAGPRALGAAVPRRGRVWSISYSRARSWPRCAATGSALPPAP